MKPLAIGVLVVLVPASAIAQDKSACVSSYEQGQVDRRAGHFDDARRDFSTCTEDSCPSVVRERCVQFARDLEAAQPSVIVAVHDASGHDVSGARLAVDGSAAAPIPATALRIDPGEHVLRVETGDGTAEQRITLREGERERRVDVTVGTKPVDVPVPKPPPSKPVGAWAMTITAGIGLVGAGALSATGWGIYSDLSSRCQHSCSEDQVAPLRVIWPAAFVALGAGVVAGVVAVVLFAVHPRHAESAAVWVAPGGIAGRF